MPVPGAGARPASEVVAVTNHYRVNVMASACPAFSRGQQNGVVSSLAPSIAEEIVKNQSRTENIYPVIVCRDGKAERVFPSGD